MNFQAWAVAEIVVGALILFLTQHESSPPSPPPGLVLSVNVDERDLEGVESLSHASRDVPRLLDSQICF